MTEKTKCTLCKGKGVLQIRSANYRTIKCNPCKGRGYIVTEASASAG